MATIGTGTTSFLNTPRRQYITTTAFQNDIFRYTTSTNPTTFQVTGTLTSLATVGTGTAANCPANRILRENGKKLYPSGLYEANNTTYGAPNPGVTTYMVGVYDPVSFLNGFIDPNSKVFAPYNTDKPEYVPRGINPNGNTEVDQGPPVYTLGTVTAGTTITAGTTVTAGTGVVATTGQLRADTVTTDTTTTGGTITIDFALGQVFKFTATMATNVTLATTNNAKGAVAYIIFSNGGGRTIIGDGSSYFGAASATMTNAKIYTVTCVSDGTDGFQVAAVQGA
jgi:hypothetical protein